VLQDVQMAQEHILVQELQLMIIGQNMDPVYNLKELGIDNILIQAVIKLQVLNLEQSSKPQVVPGTALNGQRKATATLVKLMNQQVINLVADLDTLYNVQQQGTLLAEPHVLNIGAKHIETQMVIAH
jgi:hypothetical protein